MQRCHLVPAGVCLEVGLVSVAKAQDGRLRRSMSPMTPLKIRP